jgi:hypothetical protein
MSGIDAESTLERAGHRLAALSAIRGLWATVVGIALVVIAFATAQGGAWFVPLLAIGLALIAAGILGPRIRGRVSLEFGMGGATLDVQLHIAPPGQVGRLPRRGAVAVAAPEAPVPGTVPAASGPEEPTVVAEAVPAVSAPAVEAVPAVSAPAVEAAPVTADLAPSAPAEPHHDPAAAAIRAARAAEAVAAVVAASTAATVNGNGTHALTGNGSAPAADADQPAAEPDRS